MSFILSYSLIQLFFFFLLFSLILLLFSYSFLFNSNASFPCSYSLKTAHLLLIYTYTRNSTPERKINVLGRDAWLWWWCGLGKRGGSGVRRRVCFIYTGQLHNAPYWLIRRLQQFRRVLVGVARSFGFKGCWIVIVKQEYCVNCFIAVVC